MTGASVEPRRVRWWYFALPALVYLAHSLCLGAWIVDDAAISFAYARNLAEGHGLVAFPGLTPVEGYSNPTWVLVCALAYLAGVFDPVWTPKAIALVCVVFTLQQMLRIGSTPGVGCVAGVLLATNPGFVIWCSSGLENPLYALLVVTLCRVSWRLAEHPGTRMALVAAGLAALVAATRPDGLVFAGGPVVVLTVAFWIGRFEQRSAVTPALFTYLGAVAGLLALGFLSRYLYFGDWLPNTYYAKGAATQGRTAVAVARFCALVLAFLLGRKLLRHRRLGVVGYLVVFAAATVLIQQLRVHATLRWLAKDVGMLLGGLVLLDVATLGRDLGLRRAGLLGFAVSGLFGFAALPRDWMGEYRFATPAMPFVALLLVEAAGRFLRATPPGLPWWRVGLVAAASLGLVANAADRTRRFVAAPTNSLQTVLERRVLPLRRVAAALLRRRGAHSVMLSDAGATLWDGTLRMVDAGMLCDRTLARAFRRGDRAAALTYVFEVAQPSLVLTDIGDDQLLQLDGDPRFRRDYVAVLEYPERKVATGNPAVATGLFVRRELLLDAAGVERLRALFVGP